MAKRNGWITVKGIIITAIVVLLAVGVWGGLKLAEERGEQVRRAEAVEEAERNLENLTAREAEAAEKEAEERAESEKSEDSDRDVAVGGVDNLPETGPGETMAVLALAGMAFATSSYVSSRRRLKSLTVDHL